MTRALSLLAAVGLILDLSATLARPAAAQAPDTLRHGKYLFEIAGCAACHTAPGGQLLAGGRALKTPFGTFYGPNITADKAHGIGAWSDKDFIRALRDGAGPGNRHLFPVFPYTSFTYMTDADMLAIKAYIFSLPTSDTPSKPHDITFPFGWRGAMAAWKLMYLYGGPLVPDPKASAAVNRGAYIVKALGHCGECHTPRDILGAMKPEMYLAGTPDGPDGDPVANITSDKKTGIGGWTDDELTALFRDGTLPFGDEVGGAMTEVVRNETSKLTAADLKALIAYLRTVPPIENRPYKKKKK